MSKIKNVLSILFQWASEKDLNFFRRFDHIPDFYHNFSKVGPFQGIVLTICIALVFVPILILEWLTNLFDWSSNIHDLLYLVYIVSIFCIIVVWLIFMLIAAVKRGSAVRNYAKTRKSRS